MSTLDDLFPDGKRQTQTNADDEQQTVRRLDQLLGDRRADIDRTHRASARPALVAMVERALADARPLGTVPAASHPDSRRPRRRFDLLNVSLAALAVVALAAAGLIGGVQAATASPATDALRVLAADEKTIESATAGLESARERLIESVEEADAAAAALRPALESVRSAPDPADVPPGETEAPADAVTIPIADPKALDTVLAALDSYRTDLSAFNVPGLPEPYERGAVDSDSLTEVGAAIDQAQLQLGEIDRVSAQIRVGRTSLDDRNAAFAAELATFAKTFPGLASAAVDDNGDADEDLRDAVVTAANALTKTDLQTAAGAASLTAYREAVVALVADQVYADRLREERERELEEVERERQRQRQWQPSPTPEPTPDVTPQPDPEQTEPPTESEGSGDVVAE